MECEMPSCSTHATPKARFEHRCCECGGIINRGEMYHRISGIWDGYPARYLVCNDCEEIRTAIDKTATHNEDRTPYGYLSEVIMEKENIRLRPMFLATVKARKSNIKWLMEAQ